MAVKCNITTFALDALNKMRFGFNCMNPTRQIVENYVEYLNCPIETQFCTPPVVCDPVTDTVTCDITPIIILASNVTINSVVLTFPIADHDFTVYILVNSSVVFTFENPDSPLVVTGLTPVTTYTVRYVIHCPYGETVETSIQFTTLLACAQLVSMSGVVTEE